VLLVSLFGREMLAYTARFIDENGVPVIAPNFSSGTPPEVHFENMGSALIASFNIFYNEEWHIVMLEFARVTRVSFVYFVISVILG
jgi:hypothetical protein